MTDRVLILDFGSQVTQLIARRIRESGVYCEIHPFNVGAERIRAFGPKAIVLSGVSKRFPTLNFAFLEGGVAWASELYAGLVGHCGKRHSRAMERYDPHNIDAGMLADLFADTTNRFTGIWHAAPALVQLEANVLDWFRTWMGFPPSTRGLMKRNERRKPNRLDSHRCPRPGQEILSLDCRADGPARQPTAHFIARAPPRS